MGDTLPGSGGLVIYKGSDLTFTDTGLSANSLYYYQAWSVANDKHYSVENVLTNATTTPEPGFYLLFIIYQLLFISRWRKLKVT